MLLVARCPGCRRPDRAVCAACVRGLRAPAPPIDVPVGLHSLAVVLSYEGVARELITGLKYRNTRGALGPLGAAMASRVECRPDVVTWLPTTARRARGRGYDQAELLAREVAMRLGAPCRRLLVRRGGPPQTGRSRLSRLDAPHFRASRKTSALAVLLVDDVVTSGASMSAAACALLAAGGRVVHGVAAAHTPRTLVGPGTARSGPWTSP